MARARTTPLDGRGQNEEIKVKKVLFTLVIVALLLLFAL